MNDLVFLLFLFDADVSLHLMIFRKAEYFSSCQMQPETSLLLLLLLLLLLMDSSVEVFNLFCNLTRLHNLRIYKPSDHGFDSRRLREILE